MSQPNIVLITSDQQRYDTLRANGNPRLSTPHLDALAQSGANFRQAYVVNPVCVASRASIQTGRYTHQHGVDYMEDVVDNTPGLPPWEVTFMERLQAAGYVTGAFGKIHMYPPKGFHETKLSGGQGARWHKTFGLPLGASPMGNEYAEWLEARRPGGFEAIHAQRATPAYRQYGSAVTSVLDFEEYVDTWVAANSIDFVQRRAQQSQPFFLWCGFLNPHTPLDAPAPYDTLYDPADIPLPETFLADVSDRPDFYAARQRALRGAPDSGPDSGANAGDNEAKVRRMLAFYYGLCTMLDDLSGRLFATLHETGVWDNTLIIYVSDHGDMMGDFGMMGKSNFMQGSIHVPLVIKPPQSGGAGREIDGLVENIDLAPTILDYADAPRPAAMQGISLRGILDGTDPVAAQGKAQILCEYTGNHKEIRGKCLRTPGHKYIVWQAEPGQTPQEELYDMAADPAERHNLATDPAHAGQRADLRLRLVEQLMNSEKPLMSWL